jgi:hypothetical protein
MSGRILLPCRSYIQGGNFSLDLISTWVVITAHSDKAGRAFPSIERIAGLAGIRKASAISAIATLERQDIIEVSRDDGKHTYTVHRYRAGDTENARQWISLPASLIMSGSWAVFPRSAKICYLYLCAHAWPGRAADGWQVWEKSDGWSEWRKKDYPFDFIDESRIPLQIPGLPARTGRFARNWLASHGFINVYRGDLCAGLALPHEPPPLPEGEGVLGKLRCRMEKNKRTMTRTINALSSHSRRAAQVEGLVQ